MTSDRIADLTKADADVRIKEADARAAEAGRAAAEANQRAEEAKAEVARTHERLHKHQQMRRLTTDQKAALSALLKSDRFQSEPRPNLYVDFVADAEAESYALQFRELLRECGFPQNDNAGSIFQRIDVPEGIMFSAATFETTVENEPLAIFHRIAEGIGLKMALMPDPRLRPGQGCISIFRKPAV